MTEVAYILDEKNNLTGFIVNPGETEIRFDSDNEGLTDFVTYLTEHFHELEKDITVDLTEDFKEWDKVIKRLNKNGRRLVEIKETYETESEKLLNNARQIKEETEKDIIKEKYGGNNDKTRKKYVEEQLSDLLDEKKELELRNADDNRKISYLTRLIDMKIELIKFNGI